MFMHGFRNLGGKVFRDRADLPLSERSAGSDQHFWDCHYCLSDGKWQKKGLAFGIMQLAAACGLEQHLPADTGQILDALFAYRNAMFHQGYEWPVVERAEFAERIKRDGWGKDWFTKAETDYKPWVFYMSHEFIDLILQRFSQWVEAFGKLYLENLDRLATEDEAEELSVDTRKHLNIRT